MTPIRHIPVRLRISRSALLMLFGTCLLVQAFTPQTATALVKLDFEQTFFRIPGREIWDFCIVQQGGLYHIFYIDVDENATGNKTDWLGHATSPDLTHWNVQPPALYAGPSWWDDWSVWAPHVVRDEPNARWVMAYTGVDSLRVQRACMAYSTDLATWTKEPANPVFEPDSLSYFWSPTTAWSSFRDPFLYFESGEWHMLSTAALRLGGFPGYRKAIVHHASSSDFVTWTDQGALYVHDGPSQNRDLESPFYIHRNGLDHLFFTEYYSGGVSHIAAPTPAGWTFADRTVLDDSAAPEILDIGGTDILGRYVTYQHPSTGEFSFVARFDTLHWLAPDSCMIYKPDPLLRNWPDHSGTACLGNPVFGDNPAERGAQTAGPIGTFSFSSQEYYQGPMSGIGAPGAYLGDFAQGYAQSRPFVVAGDIMTLMVGGGAYPTTCYVALMDAVADTILLRETGTGVELMSQRIWDISPYQGMTATIKIVDAENGAMGHICVDEIVESMVPSSAAPTPRNVRVATVPNPFNPRTEFRFQLAGQVSAQVQIHDLRGRRVWSSPPRTLDVGTQAIPWNGIHDDGRAMPGGTYIFRLVLDGRTASTGRLTLIR